MARPPGGGRPPSSKKGAKSRGIPKSVPAAGASAVAPSKRGKKRAVSDVYNAEDEEDPAELRNTQRYDQVCTPTAQAEDTLCADTSVP